MWYIETGYTPFTTCQHEVLLRNRRLQPVVAYAQGKTGPEIAAILHVSLKQAYDSLRRQKIARKSFSEQRLIMFENKPPSLASKEVLSVQERELMVAACMLYYGEGAKTETTVDSANSDAVVILIFLKFLRDICRVDESRIRCYLYCFSDQDADALIDFWSSHLDIKRSQFTKPYVRSIFDKGTRTMSHGVLHVRYSGKKLLRNILSLISEITSSLA